MDIFVYDKVFFVIGDEVMEIVREVGWKEGILVGILFGVVIVVVLKVVKELGKGKKVLVVVFDNGECYLFIVFY